MNRSNDENSPARRKMPLPPGLVPSRRGVLMGLSAFFAGGFAERLFGQQPQKTHPESTWKMPAEAFHQQVLPRLADGVPTMFEVPWAERAEDLKGADFAFLGIPWEGTGYSYNQIVQRKSRIPDPKSIGGRSGCHLAPAFLRAHSDWLSLRATNGRMPEYGPDFVLNELLHIVDYGDAPLPPADLYKATDIALARVGDIVDAGAVPLVLGGEHSIPAMVLPAISKRRKSKTGIIWFDAHYDLHWGPCPLNEASALHQIYTTTQNDPHNLVIIGIQGCQNLLNWQAAAAGIGATVFTMTEVEELGIDEVTRRAIATATRGCEQVYVSIDADVFAYPEFTANRYPQGPFGLTARQLRQSLRRIARECRLAAVDFTCFAPPYDTQGAGAATVAYLFLEVLAQQALRKHGQKAKAARTAN